MISPNFFENFEAFSEKMMAHVREKAANAGSTIVYMEGEDLVEENPATGERRILEEEMKLPV